MLIDTHLQPHYNQCIKALDGFLNIICNPKQELYMAEKYKIYLPEDTKAKLINDAELFEFIKNDGSVNLNGFLRELITNYFDQYRTDKDALTENMLRDLTLAKGIKPREAKALTEKLIKTYIEGQDMSYGKSAALTLTVSGESESIIRIIESNLLRDSSLSGYIKDMFLSYLSMPRSKREAVIFAKNYELISEAILGSRKVSFFSGSEHKTIVEPYLIATSKEEQFGYLLCYDSKYTKKRSFRISRLKDLFITNLEFTKDPEIEGYLLAKSLKSPHSMNPDIHARVRLTDSGKHMYRRIIKNRPQVTKTEGDIYVFDWPEMQLADYFKRFGEDAVVVSPKSLKATLRNYYENALKAYEA